MRATMLCLALPLALAACSKPAEKAAEPAGAAPAANAAVTPGAMPSRKEGLWKQTIKAKDTTIESRFCIDAALDKRMTMWSQGTAGDNCSKNEIHRGLDGTVTFDTVCALGSGGTVASKGVAKGDFGSHYTVTVEGTVSGAPVEGMNGTNTTVIEADYQGPCPSGWKPGDMEMALPGMPKMKVNFDKMQEMAKRAGGH